MSEEVIIDQGVVNAYDSFKGFGFIRRQKGRDVFFFYDDLVDEDEGVLAGDVVRFEVRIESKGPRAYKVVKLAS